MERVIVESPYAGKEKWEITINEWYCELCLNDCLVNHNESPYASHLLYTRKFVLKDKDPKERKLGIKAGFFWREVAERTVFYCDLGMTKGMEQGMEDIKDHMRYDLRWLPNGHWDMLIEECEKSKFGIPKRIMKI
jgi:hypothetical protein